MSIILARHGQTEYNRDGKILGAIDSPLTEKGRNSARKLAQVLAGLKPDRVFSSPLGRARDTAGILTRGLEQKIQLRAEMAELSAGAWEGLSRREALGEDGVLIRRDWRFRPPEGEGYLDGETRLAPLIRELRELPGTSLVVGHFAINRSFLKSWLGLKEERVLGLDIPHEVLYLLEDDGRVSWFDNQERRGEGFLEWKI